MSFTEAWIPVIIVVGVGSVLAIPAINIRSGLILHTKLRNFLPRWNIFRNRSDVLDVSVGEVFATALFIALLLLRFFRYFLPGADTSNAHVFRAIGELNFATLAFLVLPVNRYSVWWPIMGISFERALKYHKFWAQVTYIIMLIHGIGMLAYYTMDDVKGLKYALAFEKNARGWSNLSGLLAFLCMSLMVVFSEKSIRRKKFEVFYYIHLAMVIPVYVFAGLHMPLLLRWMYPAIAFRILDYILRFYSNYMKSASISSIKFIQLSPTNLVTKLCIAVPKKRFGYAAGQYFMVTIPSISSLESHPFSTSLPLKSNPDPNKYDEITFHIKNMGAGTWTSKLSEVTSASFTSCKFFYFSFFGCT